MSTSQRTFLGALVLLAVAELQTVAAIAPAIAGGTGTIPSRVSMSLAFFALSAVAACVVLSLGRLNSNPERTIRWAGVVFGVCAIAGAFSQNIVVFTATRACAGFSGGLISALSISVAARGSDYRNRGSRMSLISFGHFAAPLALVPLNVLAAGSFGWRPVMLLNGTLIVGAALGMGGSTAESTPDRPGTPDRSLFKGELRNARMAAVAAAFFVSGAFVGFTAYLGIWLNSAFEGSAATISITYAGINVCAFLAGTAGGFVGDRFGKRRVSLLATVLMGVGFAGIASGAGAIPGLLFTGAVVFGASLRNAPLNAIVVSLVPQARTPGFVAVRNIASQAGIGFAIVVSGSLFVRGGIGEVALFCGALTVASFAILRLIPEDKKLREPSFTVSIAPEPLPGKTG